ncbi:uncharacterized protein LOC119856038 [Dermochelys coriacea]|uniref:uncharacterized protein LOC119856038 n=1 Tax=Dermochelys coriacea TaxID=27794 RepID=UPI001CA8BD97|nr:uncharacterized protein LOC119856038 [Dermochelys coriacea]
MPGYARKRTAGVQTKEDLLDLIVLELLYEQCPSDLRLRLVDKKLENPQHAGQLDDEFMNTKAGEQHYTLTSGRLLCQEDENVTEGKKHTEEERATKETKPRPGPTPGQQGQAANSKCILTGLWRNELGSEMQIQQVNGDGTFSGEYHTAVSLASRPIQPASLNGSQHFDEEGQPTFGFTVNWKRFSGSAQMFSPGSRSKRLENP